MENLKRQEDEVLLTGMLAEYREALQDEIKKIEKRIRGAIWHLSVFVPKTECQDTDF